MADETKNNETQPNEAESTNVENTGGAEKQAEKLEIGSAAPDGADAGSAGAGSANAAESVQRDDASASPETSAAEASASDAPQESQAAGSGDRAGEPQGEQPGRGEKSKDDRRGRGRGRGPRKSATASDLEAAGLEDNVVKVYRCATVVKGGRRFSFAALVVVGDRNGRVGIGYGKANEVPSAVEKATKAARRDMIKVQLDGTTLPHQVMARFGASKVLLIPAQEGTGVIAGGTVRSVMELAGVKDVLTKSYGSNSPKNLVKATFEGLKQLRSRQQVEDLRQVKVAS
jgi:small subunit ribosomal protein S5